MHYNCIFCFDLFVNSLFFVCFIFCFVCFRVYILEFWILIKYTGCFTCLSQFTHLGSSMDDKRKNQMPRSSSQEYDSFHFSPLFWFFASIFIYIFSIFYTEHMTCVCIIFALDLHYSFYSFRYNGDMFVIYSFSIVFQVFQNLFQVNTNRMKQLSRRVALFGTGLAISLRNKYQR